MTSVAFREGRFGAKVLDEIGCFDLPVVPRVGELIRFGLRGREDPLYVVVNVSYGITRRAPVFSGPPETFGIMCHLERYAP